MAGFKLTAFGGFVPRVSPTLLQDNEAVKALNSKLYSGSLRPWQKTKAITPAVSVPGATQTIHREYTAGGASVWFAWSTDVDIVKGPLTDTQAFRFYYTGDGYPKKTNATLAGTTSGTTPSSFLSLGVPAPKSAPTVTNATPGTGTAEVRVYTYTLISQFGDIYEESAPAAASNEVTVYAGDTVTVSSLTQSGTYARSGTTVTITETAHGLITGDVVRLDFTTGTATDGVYTVTVLTANTYTITDTVSGTTSGNVTIIYKAPAGKYNFTHRRIYRSVTGTGTTSFNFVAEVPITTASYSDTKTSAQLGEVIKTLDWEPPPAAMKGIVELPNGILAGFTGKYVYFSEPNYPHSWPSKYQISTEYNIVGLGVYGQSLVVLTEGNPYIVSGVSSESMSSEKVAIIEPCVSKRTIVSDSNGVMYASPNGIMEIGPAGPNLITRNIMLKDEFAVYDPDTAFAKSTQSKYFFFYNSGLADPQIGALIFDRNLPATPLSITNTPGYSAWVDKSTSILYMVGTDNQIMEWEGDTYNRLPFEWTSKQFILNYPVNLGAVEILADFADIQGGVDLQAEISSLQAANQTLWAANSNLLGSLNNSQLNTYVLNGSILSPVPTAVDERFVLLIVYADGVEKHRIQATGRGTYRIPSGFRSDNWQFKITGNIPLYHVKIAETPKELRAL